MASTNSVTAFQNGDVTELPNDYIVPVTRFPPLHPYEKQDSVETSPIWETRGLQRARRVDETAIGIMLQLFARALISLTGLDEVAFALVIHAHLDGVVHATLGETFESLKLRIFSLKQSNMQAAWASSDFAFVFDNRNRATKAESPSFVVHHTKFVLKFRSWESEATVFFRKSILPAEAIVPVIQGLEAMLQERDPTSSNESRIGKESVTRGDDTCNLSIVNFPPKASNRSTIDSQNESPTFMHTGFEHSVRDFPENIALEFLQGDGKRSSMTYAQLNDAANSLAATIIGTIGRPTRQNQNGPDVVPFYITQSLELYIAYLGILKAGFAFCPLPLDVSEERLSDLVISLKPRTVLILGDPDSAPNALRHLTLIDVQSSIKPLKEFKPDPPIDIRPTDLAYIITTSGSTGKPKGVQIQHFAISCSIQSHSLALPLSKDPKAPTRWFQFAATGFDPSIIEIFLTWWSAATLCSAERQLTLSDPEKTVTQLEATILMTTPSVAALLRPDKLPTLKSIWTVGETLTRIVIDNFAVNRPFELSSAADLHTGPRGLVNMYGPTEVSVHCTTIPMDKKYRGSIIGRALITCSVLILQPHDRRARPVPMGFTGELAIGGPQLSLGYLHRPKETRDSFVDSSKYGRLYRTGDRARIVWSKKGEILLEFLGRISIGQVKLQGRRVELGEIEGVLMQLEGLAEVAVAAVSPPDSPKRSQVVALLVLRPGQYGSKMINVCRQRASSALPDYMHPAFYEVLPSLPRTSSSKIDRKAVAIIAQDILATKLTYIADEQERNQIHEASDIDRAFLALISKLIAETVGLAPAKVLPASNIYTLGLDSLASMRLLQSARERGVHELSVKEVLQAGTPAAIAELVTKKRGRQQKLIDPSCQSSKMNETRQRLIEFNNKHKKYCAALLRLSEDEIEVVYPTTATQSGIVASFMLSAAQRRQKTYINHSILHLRAGLQISRLKKSWETVVKRHQVFRTRFITVDDDLAPFAQCIISSNSAQAKVRWRQQVIEGEEKKTHKASLQSELRQIEELINLEATPFTLSILSTPSHEIMVVSLSHPIFDGGSFEMLLEEVSSHYNGELIPERSSLQKAVEAHFSANREAATRFWADHLGGASAPTFPDLTGLRTQDKHGVSEMVEIDSSISSWRLREGAKAMGVSSLSILQTAWITILASYCGTTENIIFGSVMSGRFNSQLEVCMAPAFSILPIKCPDESGNTSFAEMCQRFATINRDSLDYLHPRLGSINSTKGSLPYDTCLAFQEYGVITGESRFWEDVEYPPMADDFATMIEIWPTTDGKLRMRSTFTDANLNAEAATIMLKEMDAILQQIMLNSGRPWSLGSLNVDHELLSIYSAQRDTVSKSLLHSKFEQYAQKSPETLALIFADSLNSDGHFVTTEWTFWELNRRADDLSKSLRVQFGSLKGVYVPLCMNRSVALYVTILGVLKAGGAWCPIDPSFPRSRRHDLVVRTGAPMVLVSSGEQNEEHWVPEGIELVHIDSLGQQFSVASYHFTDIKSVDISSDDPAYLIWTSGTTGNPKGVPITHGAAATSISSLQEIIPGNYDGGQVRCMQTSQFTFDVFVQDIFYTWGLGGVVISSTKDIMLQFFSELANHSEATHAQLTPAFATEIDHSSCETLKVTVMLGEKLPQSVADDWTHPGTVLFNAYGPAENTILSTVRELGEKHISVSSSNIGFPLPSVGACVLNDDLPVMCNSVGELALTGPQLSRGYLDSLDQTSSKFVWNDALQQHVFKTGDQVRMLSDRSLDFIGRLDDLVKLNGIRVELSEIEYILRGCHPSVTQVSVQHLNRPDRVAKLVVAFLAAPNLPSQSGDRLLQTGEATAPIVNEALNLAQRSLPHYMVPSFYLVLRRIPRTPSHKVDRDALRKVYESVDLSLTDGQSTMTTTNKSSELQSGTAVHVIKKISQITGIDRKSISQTSRLLALGLDSIRVLRLVTKMRADGIVISVADIFSSVTVQELIALVEKNSKKSTHIFAQKKLQEFDRKWNRRLRDNGVQGSIRVTPVWPLQESFLGETMLNPQNYWDHHFFELDSSVDPVQILRAWSHLVRKIEVLRTSFFPVAKLAHQPGEGSDLFLQIVHEDTVVDARLIEIKAGTLIDAATQRSEQIALDRHESNFDSPLCAITIFDDGSFRTMMISVHHAIYDGPSIQYIMHDLAHAYRKKPIFERLQTSQGLALSTVPTEGQEQATLDFWTEYLAEFKEHEAKTFPDLSGRVHPVKTKPMFLSQTINLSVPYSVLQTLAKSLEITSTMAILRVAFGSTLAEYLESDSIFFGETFSNRICHPDLAEAIGPLISVLPMTVRLNASAREMILEQAQFLERSIKHRHIHPRTIKHILGIPPMQTMYSAIFTYNPEIQHECNECSVPLWKAREALIPFSAEHQLALNVEQGKSDSVSCSFSALDTIMNGDQLHLFAQQVDVLVSIMVKHLDTSIREFASLFPQHLLSIAKPIVTDAIRNAPKVAPFYWIDHWASVHPAWPALEVASSITEDKVISQKWTYEELRQMSDRVANLLCCKKLNKTNIAVCLGRSFFAYALVLGIWKSGNCYLPIAEDLPPERQSLLLHDSGSSALFSESSYLPSFTVPAGCQVFDVDAVEFAIELKAVSSKEPAVRADPDDDCYLLYTSGSTGTPKGVLVTRGNVSAFTEAQSDFICREVPDTRSLGGTGKYLAHASRAFDVHICEMVLAWRHGLSLVTAPRAMLLDNLPLALSSLHVTHSGFVPSLLDQAGLEPSHVPALRYMGVGGEKLSQRIIDTFAASKYVTLVNAYGPTEVTIGLTSINVSPETSVRNIGKVVGNITAHVLQPQTCQYVKKGQAGELCVTGDLVAKGYYRRPEAKGFVDFHGARMYRTGDIVRLLADDSIEFLGRSDSQAKIRGQRLELEEVSAAVRRSANEPVDVTSIIALSPATGRPQLVSFVSRASQRRTDKTAKPIFLKEDYDKWSSNIIAGCQRTLPAYMVPNLVIPLTFIPVQISGKADIRLLKALYESIPRQDLLSRSPPKIIPEDRNNVEDPAEQELSPDEKKLRDILQMVVSFDENVVNKFTSILDLGIDSLNVISLAIRLKAAGYECSVSDIMLHPILYQLAQLPSVKKKHVTAHTTNDQARQKLKELELSYRKSHIADSHSRAVRTVRPCFPLQESIVASSLRDNSHSLYVNHLTLKFSKDVNIPRLKAAWTDLVDDMDILRTIFSHFNNEIIQVVLKPRATSLPWSQVSLNENEDIHQYLQSRQTSIAAEIVEQLTICPPFRLLVASSQKQRDYFILVSIHHSLYDADTMGLLLTGLYAHYQGDIPRPQGDLNALHEHLLARDTQAARIFWTRYLQGYTPTSAVPSRYFNHELSVIQATLPQKLSTLSKCVSQCFVTLSALFETMYGLSLAQIIGQRDIVFGKVLNGRILPVQSPESLAVPLVTTLPTRLNIKSLSSNLKDLVKEVYTNSVEAIEYQHTAIRQIQRWLKSETPLFDSLFSYIVAGQKPEYWKIMSEVDSKMATDYPLAFEVTSEPHLDKVTLRAGFASAFVPREQAKRLLEDVELLLQAFIDNVDMSLEFLQISDYTPIRHQSEASPWDESVWSRDEKAIRTIVAEMCGLEESYVTKNSSFFALGIDSVTALQLARKLQQHKFKVSSMDVMQHHSVGALADRMKQSHSVRQETEVPSTSISELKRKYFDLMEDEGKATDVFLCTPLQTAMISRAISSGGKLYTHHHAFLLAPHTDLQCLKAAWTHLVSQRDILRTSFHQHTDYQGFIGVVHETAPLYWSVIEDVQSIPDAINLLISSIAFSCDADFHLPPVRVTVLKSTTESVLVVTLHHCLYDGMSIRYLFDDFATAYRAERLPARPLFAAAAHRISRLQEQSARFWVKNLSGYIKPSVPQVNKPEARNKLHIIEKRLNRPVHELLQQCAALDVTLQTASLLAFGKALSILLQRRDVVFGQVVAGRSLDVDDAENIIGPLFNTVPFRVRLDNVLKSNKTSVVELQQFCVDAQIHQHACLSNVQKAWRKRTGDNSPRLFDALFTFVKAERPGGNTTADLFKPFKFDDVPEDADHNLNFELEQGQAWADLRVSGKGTYFTSEGLSGFVRVFEETLQDVLTQPERSVVGFPPGLQNLPLIGSTAQAVPSTDTIEIGPDLTIVRESLAETVQLPVEDVQAGSNVYALGLDSIAAIKVVSLCRARGLVISVSDILQGVTLGGIVKLVRHSRQNKSDKQTSAGPLVSSDSKRRALSLVNINEDNVEGIFPCLGGQIYHLSAWLNSARTLYEPTWTFVSKIKLDPTRLKNAWLQLRKHHSILRTIFAATSPDDIVQVILKKSGVVENETYDHTTTSVPFEEFVIEKVKAIARQPSDLFAPPVRLSLIQHPWQDAVLLTLNHAIYDAWSVSILLSDLMALYNEKELGPYVEFSSFVEYIKRNSSSLKEKEFWDNYLQRGQSTILGSDSTSSAGSLPRKPSLQASNLIPGASQLDSRLRDSGLTIHSALLLAFGRLLSRKTNVIDPVVGLYQHGRSGNFSGITNVSGPTLNILPFVILGALSRPTIDAARSIQEDLQQRKSLEQSDPRNMFRTIKPQKGGTPDATTIPQFNVIINLLWTRSRPNPFADPNAFLEPLYIGSPIDFAPEKQLPAKTAIDDLDTSWLKKDNVLFIDLDRSTSADSIDIGLRYDGESLHPPDIEALLHEFMQEMEHIGREFAIL